MNVAIETPIMIQINVESSDLVASEACDTPAAFASLGGLVAATGLAIVVAMADTEVAFASGPTVGTEGSALHDDA